jgi:peptide/nickel transport system substrate-binding protein
VVSLLTLLTACGSSATPTPQSQATSGAATAGGSTTTSYDRVDNTIANDHNGSGGTLTIALSAGNLPFPNTPPNEGYEGQRFVGYQIYDTIVGLNYDQGDTVPVPSPGLAEKWSVADDKITWTFQIRKGVKFHDGTDLDAEAIVFNLNRISNKDFEYYDPSIAGLSGLSIQGIKSYKATSQYELEIKTPAPYAFLPWDLSHVFIASPTAIKKYGNKDYIQHATGTGPFKMTNYVDGQVMELVPNENYWKGRPKLDKLVLRPMPDPATRLAALQSGEVNWAEVPPPDSVKQLSDKGFNVLLKQYPHTIIFSLNTYDKPFSDPKVRQALQYAIDRDGMCNSLLKGLCYPAYQYLFKGHPWYDDQFGATYKYDPAKAKQLLAEAGYPNGFKFTLAYPTGGSGNMWPGQMMELVQANYKAVGIDMTLAPLEWNTIISLIIAGAGDPASKKYDAVYISLAPDSPSAIYQFFSETRIPPKGCCNSTGYSNPKVEQLFSQAVAEFDPGKLDNLIKQAMGQVAADAPFTFVVHDLNLRVLSPKVRGFVPSRSWFANLNNVWVKG